jgi:hypothetical protein
MNRAAFLRTLLFLPFVGGILSRSAAQTATASKPTLDAKTLRKIRLALAYGADFRRMTSLDSMNGILTREEMSTVWAKPSTRLLGHRYLVCMLDERVELP